jgi:cysteinyl-tRNA synthetase
MQTLIGSLLERDHAYSAAGEVLFAVDSMPDYGRLSGRNLEDNVAGARVAVEAHKRNPADFVLWKQSSDSEPGWPSPWGRGRPGWHIECSAMSERYLGQVFDIHAGGLDLIFPHHENEIAQSRCAHGTHAMANYWLHNGFLQVEGQKMSKSLGNFITIHELLETEKFGGRKWQGEVLRLAMLMTHYREPIDFSVKRLEEAEGKLRDWQRASADATKGAVTPPAETVIEALSDDLNFHRAALALDALAREARSEQVAADTLGATLEFLGFGLDTLLQPASVSVDAAVDIEEAINRRLEALNTRNFAEADAIRAQLLTQGVQLMDYKDDYGQRQTRWEIKR